MIDLRKQIDNWFKYYPPFGTQIDRYKQIRDVAGKRLACAIACNESPSEGAIADGL